MSPPIPLTQRSRHLRLDAQEHELQRDPSRVASPVVSSLSRPLAAFTRPGLLLGLGRFSFDTFGVLPIHKARATGCLRLLGWRGGAYPEGVELFAVHAFTFAPVELWFQLVRRLIVSIPRPFTNFIEAPMDDPLQPQLRLYGRLDAPSVVPTPYVERCNSYREAVRMAFALRRVRNLTLRSLAEQADLPPQHVSDYLNADDKKKRRNLPAERIAQFEGVVGNTCVSQWLATRVKLTVLEEMTATREAA